MTDLHESYKVQSGIGIAALRFLSECQSVSTKKQGNLTHLRSFEERRYTAWFTVPSMTAGGGRGETLLLPPHLQCYVCIYFSIISYLMKLSSNAF